MDLIPLFPLHTVLVPGGSVPLRLFEARYLDLVSRCLRDASGFGVNLIERGSEVGEPAAVYPVGTLARIADWRQLPDGLLGITVEGHDRYRVLETRIRPDRLLEARVAWLAEGEDRAVTELDDEFLSWLKTLADLVQLSLKDESGRDGLPFTGCAASGPVQQTIPAGDRPAIAKIERPA